MAENGTEPGPEKAIRARSRVWTRAGVLLLGLSVLLWVPLPAVPFLPLSGMTKASLGGGLVVGAEIAFWTGAALAGPEAARRTRSWVRGVFRGLLGARRSS